MNISLSPEVIFHIGSFGVTNSYFWSIVLILVLIFVIVRTNVKKKEVPSRAQGLLEVLIEGAYGFVRSIAGSDEKTKKVFPLVFTMFIFILAANLATFLPGQAAFSVEKTQGSVPLFRAVMADYSLVFVMTFVTIVITQIVAISVSGPFGYVGKFINLSGFKTLFKSLGKKEVGMSQLAGLIFQAFLDLFLGLMDIVGEAAKVISLSFRLFGNIFAGEVLSAVMFFIGFSVVKFGFIKVSALAASGNIIVASLINLPFMFLGLLTAIVQAFVFSVLTLIFVVMASETEVEEKEA